jgi:8-oxo-dGTP pyrophosphatase MutT (NUDIX family)
MTTPADQSLPNGYQPHTSNGPRVRTDVVDVYVFCRVGPDDPRERGHAAQAAGTSRVYEGDEGWPVKARPAVYFLQLLRAGPPLDATWHPVMGHVHAGETAAACALRELEEEVGLSARSPSLRGVWALEQVHPFYIAAIDAVVMSPRFCAEVDPSWSPALNAEHRAARWVREDEVDRLFMWPGQKACCREILREIVEDASLSREVLRVRV